MRFSRYSAQQDSLAVFPFLSLSYCPLTDVLSAIRRYNSLYPLITGKTSYPNSASPLMWVTPFLVPFYLIAFSPALFLGFPAACRLQHSIIGRFSLNRRVRDGYGCFPEAHRHRKFRVTDSKCRKYFIRLWKACFPKTLWNIFYKRRSRDRGTLFRGPLTLDNSTVKHNLLLLP